MTAGKIAIALRRIARRLATPTEGAGRSQPKHLIVYEAFRHEIEAGRLAPGARLPADNALAEALPASLATIQKALRRLADDGLLVRRHRRGTFVYDSPVAESEIRHLRFVADEAAALLPAYVHVRGIEVVRNDRDWAARFGGERELIRIDRMCNINFEFDVALETYLPARRFAALRRISPRELDRTPLAHYLEKRLGAPTVRLERRFRVVPFTDEVCTLLGCEAGTYGLEWESFVYSRDDELIMLQVAYVPPGVRWLAV